MDVIGQLGRLKNTLLPHCTLTRSDDVKSIGFAADRDGKIHLHSQDTPAETCLKNYSANLRSAPHFHPPSLEMEKLVLDQH